MGPNEKTVSEALAKTAGFVNIELPAGAEPTPYVLASTASFRIAGTVTQHKLILKELAAQPLAEEIEQAAERMPSILELRVDPDRTTGTVADPVKMAGEWVEVVTVHRRAIQRLAGALSVDVADALAPPIPTPSDPTLFEEMDAVIEGHSESLLLLARALDERA